MNNLLSYCGLVDAKIRSFDKDLPLSCSNSKISRSTLCALNKKHFPFGNDSWINAIFLWLGWGTHSQSMAKNLYLLARTTISWICFWLSKMVVLVSSALLEGSLHRFVGCNFLYVRWTFYLDISNRWRCCLTSIMPDGHNGPIMPNGHYPTLRNFKCLQ